MCSDFVRCQLSHIEAKFPRIPFSLWFLGDLGPKVRQQPFLCSVDWCRHQVHWQLAYAVRHLLAHLTDMGPQVLQVPGRYMGSSDQGHSCFCRSRTSSRMEPMRHMQLLLVLMSSSVSLLSFIAHPIFSPC